MSGDALRELAEQHRELLTVECECVNVPAISVNYSPRCTICKDTGRRLKTLEELLEAAAATRPARDRQPCLARCEVLRGLAGYMAMRCGTDSEMGMHEAAARLLV